MIFLTSFFILFLQFFVPSEAQSGECNSQTNIACITKQYFLPCQTGTPNYAVPMIKCGSNVIYGSTDATAVCYSGALLQNQVCGLPPLTCTREGVFSSRPDRDYYTCKSDGSGGYIQTLLSCANQFCALSGTCIAVNALCTAPVPTTAAPRCTPPGRSQDPQCRYYKLCHPNGLIYRIQCPGNTYFDTTSATCARTTNCGNRT